MRVIILGGGISGLSAAYYLLKKFPKTPVTILESTNRCGGWIRSRKLPNGVIFEEGPRTIRPVGTNTLQLIQELQLEKNIIPIPRSHPAATTRLIYANGQLHTLPSNLMSLFKQQTPFSKPLVFYLMRDLIAERKFKQDEAIYDFVERRFGCEIADYLISPLICGICAGNAKEISVNFLMKSLFELEQQYGGIAKGLILSRITGKNSQKPEAVTELAQKAKRDRWSVYSFRNGMEELPNALQQAIIKKGATIKYQAECTEIKLNNKSVHVKLKNGEILEANHLISSLPSTVLAQLTKDHSDFSKQLNSIRAVTVAVVNFSFKGKLITKEAFGFLVAPKENLPILGVIYDSCCFPKGDNTVFTVMMGGFWFKTHFGENPSEETLLNIALRELRRILKFHDEPEAYHVNILHNCIPQYTVGHNEKIKDIFNYISDNKLSLTLCGSSYFGVGVNDVILSAKNAVEEINI